MKRIKIKIARGVSLMQNLDGARLAPIDTPIQL